MNYLLHEKNLIMQKFTLIYDYLILNDLNTTTQPSFRTTTRIPSTLTISILLPSGINSLSNNIKFYIIKDPIPEGLRTVVAIPVCPGMIQDYLFRYNPIPF